MAQTKTKKSSAIWMQCEKCSVVLVTKDSEKHLQDCPPNDENITYNFIRNKVLYGTLASKTNEEIENLSSREVDNLAFLGQTAIQMCSLTIGEWCIIKSLESDCVPLAKRVWPTTEKTLTSVLFTKNGLDLSFWANNSIVQVFKAPDNIKIAESIHLVILNAPKILEINSELNNRISKSYNGHILFVGNIISLMYYGKMLKFEIKTIESSTKESKLETQFEAMNLKNEGPEIFRTNEITQWKLYRDKDTFEKETHYEHSDVQLAGVDEEINEIRELMINCLERNKISSFCEIRSVLLYGNSGTGKTSIAKALARESRASVVSLFAQDLYSNNTGSVEETIKEKLQDALKQAPSVIVIDELDILCPPRSGRLTDTEKRIVSSLLLMMDRLSEQRKKRVFIIATTNKIDNIDPVFRRYGRLDREIEIPTPSPKSRKAILNKLLVQSPVKFEDNDLQEIAMNTHGFVGADLVSLCSQADLYAAARKSDAITLDDFRLALKKVRPSAMREVQVEVPKVKWSDIGGQQKLKLILKQSVEWPLKHPDSFKRLGIEPPRGVLMFGPPGCSKTMIAKALATESGLNFLSIKGPELFSKWVGESERAVREVFRKARQVAPSIIFFDEIDALGSERTSGSSTSVQERVLAQLLTELDGVTPLGDVTIIAATNRPDRIDKALLRPGRLDRIVYVPLPDENTRRDIFQIMFAKMPVHNISVEDLVKATARYSGAEVNAVCHEAAMAALEENFDIQHIEYRHFEKALGLITPRTPLSSIRLYEEYTKNKDLL